MLFIKDYLINNKIIGLGFCNVKNSEFYKKCGYTVLASKQNNFVNYNNDGNVVPCEYEDGDVIVYEQSKSLVSYLENNRNGIVEISIPHW